MEDQVVNMGFPFLFFLFNSVVVMIANQHEIIILQISVFIPQEDGEFWKKGILFWTSDSPSAIDEKPICKNCAHIHVLYRSWNSYTIVVAGNTAWT